MREMFDENIRPEEAPEFETDRHGHHRCGRHRHPGRRGHHPGMSVDPESIEGMFFACAGMIRRQHHERFGSTQDRIIRILDENGGTMGQKALQELLRIRPGSISEILAKMEEKELITRTKDEDDRRASLITLKTEALPEKDTASVFGVLSEEEQETFKNLLKKVLDSRREAE